MPRLWVRIPLLRFAGEWNGNTIPGSYPERYWVRLLFPLLLGETFQGKHKVETSPLGSDAEVESANYTTRWFREPGCTVMALCRIPLKEEK